MAGLLGLGIARCEDRPALDTYCVSSGGLWFPENWFVFAGRK
jgi:hypothetical protein